MTEDKLTVIQKRRLFYTAIKDEEFTKNNQPVPNQYWYPKRKHAYGVKYFHHLYALHGEDWENYCL